MAMPSSISPILIDERIDRIRRRLGPSLGLADDGAGDFKALSGCRVQDAWRFDEDVHAIAANAAVLDLLTKLYGRRAFPFQTLNFPVGTQQALHTDSVHFSSIPERFMCGVWLAMEDVGPDSGPLTYVPGSHRWPVLSNTMIGRQGWQSNLRSAQHPYGDAWSALIAAEKVQQETFHPRKRAGAHLVRQSATRQHAQEEYRPHALVAGHPLLFRRLHLIHARLFRRGTGAPCAS